MTRRRAVLLLACLCWPGPGLAQTVGRLAPGEILEGRFRQERILSGLDRPLVSEGRFLLAPGRGLIWRTETPLASATVLTESGMGQFLGDRLAMRLSADRLPALARLYAILGAALAGDLTSIERDFDVAREKEGEAWRAALRPRAAPSADLPFSEIILQGRRHVEQAEIRKSDGDIDRIEFHSQRIERREPDAADLDLLSRTGG